MPPQTALSTAEFLSQIRLFAGLSDAERRSLASRMIRKPYAAGEALFFEGEPCEGMYLIASGAVKIYTSSPAGREVLLAIEHGPASVAEIPVFDGGNYPASVTAVEDVTAYFIPKQDFHQICRQDPEIVLKLLAVIGKRLRALVSVVHEVTFGSIRQRLARVLLDFYHEAGTSPFTLPATHQELASRLGTVREVVSRNLKRFQSQGLVHINRREVSILDPAGLQREAETEM